jgi:hypothetical protein
MLSKETHRRGTPCAKLVIRVNKMLLGEPVDVAVGQRPRAMERFLALSTTPMGLESHAHTRSHDRAARKRLDALPAGHRTDPLARFVLL